MNTQTDKTTYLVGNQHPEIRGTNPDPVGMLIKSNREGNAMIALSVGFFDVPGSARGVGVRRGDPVYILDLKTDEAFLAGQFLGCEPCPNDADWADNDKGKSNVFTWRIHFTGGSPRKAGSVGIEFKFNRSHRSTVVVNKLYRSLP
jgi:hypothetical protein